MPRAQKGQRFGGRVKGIPNKKTIEQALIAAQTADDAKVSGKKLAKEILEDFMLLFAGMAASLQPMPDNPTVDRQGRPADPEAFEKWARLACDQARNLAPYQSPTFRAVVVAPAPQQTSGQKRTRFTLTIFQEGGEAPPMPRIVDASPVPAET